MSHRSAALALDRRRSEGILMDRIVSSLNLWAPRMLSVLRVMSALLFLQHGLVKLIGFPVAPARQPVLFSLSWTAGILEDVTGVLLALGWLTRPAAFIASGEMAAAYFLSHAPRGFYPLLNNGNLSILYCFVFLYLVFAGPG